MAKGISGKRDIDGGYAWVIFTGCFVMYLLVFGTMKCYGVLYGEMLDYFQASAGETSWIGSLYFGLSFCAAPLATALSLRFSFRAVTFVGGLLIGTGLITSAFVPNVLFLYLTFGVITGLGSGLCTTPCVTILSLYFERRRAVVTGVVIGLGGFGVFIFPHLYRYLFDAFGFRGACLVLGGVMLNVCCAACCFRQPASLLDLEKTLSKLAEQERGQVTERGDNSMGPKQGRCSTLIINSKLSLFKQFKFTMCCLGTALAAAAHVVCIVLIPVYVQQLGSSKPLANAAVSIYGGSEIFGRIAIGGLVGKLSLTPSKVMLVILIIGAPLVFITPFLPYYAYAAIYSASVGLLPGGVLALYPLVTIETTGIDDFPKAIGIIACCTGFATLAFQRVIGWTHDLTGSWDAAFMISAILMLVAAACYFLPHIKRNETSPQPTQESGSHAMDVEMNQTGHLQTETQM